MFDNLKKTLDKSIDYAFATTEKITKTAKELAKENNLTKEDAKKLLDHLLKKSEEARVSMEKNVQDFIKSNLKKMDILTKDDLKGLEARIKKLEGIKPKPTKVTRKKPVRPKK